MLNMIILDAIGCPVFLSWWIFAVDWYPAHCCQRQTLSLILVPISFLIACFTPNSSLS